MDEKKVKAFHVDDMEWLMAFTDPAVLSGILRAV